MSELSKREPEERATGLHIEHYSQMNKEELQRAVEQAQGKQGRQHKREGGNDRARRA